MECFNHDATPAVGICKHCNKALCHNCLTDTGDGLACTGTCVQSVLDLNMLIDRSRNTASLTNRNAYLTPIFLASIGGMFLLIGLMDKRASGFLFPMGGLLLIFAFFNFYRMRQWVTAAEAAASRMDRHK
jgi:hypothetical protein